MKRHQHATKEGHLGFLLCDLLGVCQCGVLLIGLRPIGGSFREGYKVCLDSLLPHMWMPGRLRTICGTSCYTGPPRFLCLRWGDCIYTGLLLGSIFYSTDLPVYYFSSTTASPFLQLYRKPWNWQYQSSTLVLPLRHRVGYYGSFAFLYKPQNESVNIRKITCWEADQNCVESADLEGEKWQLHHTESLYALHVLNQIKRGCSTTSTPLYHLSPQSFRYPLTCYFKASLFPPHLLFPATCR